MNKENQKKSHITSKEIRENFQKFFQEKGHKLIQYSPLVPSEQDSTMFTIAGMKQFTNIFLGMQKPAQKSAVTIQPCIRLNDLDIIGKSRFHCSFFEMLGNFSFGAYFRQEAIEFAYEFLTKILKINPNKLYFTVHIDDKNSYEVWKKIVGDRVILMETDDNFWRSGNIGPCGYCTEIYYKIPENPMNLTEIKNSILNSTGEILEIWNIVLMEYNQTINEKVKLTNNFMTFDNNHGFIDTGMGLERITAVLQETFDVYKIDLNLNTFNKNFKQFNDITIARILTDHCKTIAFLLAENLKPAAESRGYIIRKLIRKCCFYTINLSEIVEQIIQDYQDIYPHLLKNKSFILKTLAEEIEKFQNLIEANKVFFENKGKWNDAFCFDLYQNNGIPIDLMKNFAEKNNLKINWQNVENMVENHKTISKQKININYLIPTKNLCYDQLENESKVVFIQNLNNESLEKISDKSIEFCFLTESSCFYARSGGQEGDFGTFSGKNFAGKIIKTLKQTLTWNNNLTIHIAQLDSGTISVGDSVILKVNKEIRLANTRAHSALHLSADYLMKKFNLYQAGSYVHNDYATIDLCGENIDKITQNELNICIKNVNNIIFRAINTEIYTEKKEILAKTFTQNLEEFGDMIRVVKFADKTEVFSHSFCGGTHIKNSNELGFFWITSFISKGKNIKRFEIMTHNRAINFLLINQKNNENIEEIKKVPEKKLEKKISEESINNINLLIFEDLHEDFIAKYIKQYENLILIIKSMKKIICKNVTDSILKIIKSEFELFGGGKEIKYFTTKLDINLEKFKKVLKS